MKELIVLMIAFISLNLYAQNTDEYSNSYIVVADTTLDYNQLRDMMFDINEKLGLKIDTMGRTYDNEKKNICLPEDSEDEIYAGAYLPRRYSSESLSIEPVNYYNGNINSESLALVILITEDRKEADDRLSILKRFHPDSFIISSKLFIGCIH